MLYFDCPFFLSSWATSISTIFRAKVFARAGMKLDDSVHMLIWSMTGRE